MTNPLQELVLAGGPPSSTRSRVLTRAVVGCLALIATAWGTWTWLPRPGDRLVERKQELLAAGASQARIVFLGNSLVYRHIDPEAFEQGLKAATGESWPTLNLGLPSMTAGEAYWWLRDIVDAPGERRPEYVILELAMLPEEAALNVHSERFRYWHGLTETALMVRHALRAPGGTLQERLDCVTHHLEAFGDRVLARGVLVSPESNLTGDGARLEEMVEAAGYQPLRLGKGRSDARHEYLLANPQEFRAGLRSLRRGEGIGAAERAVAQALLLKPLVDLCADSDVRLIFSVSPTFQAVTWFYGGETELHGVPVIAFNDPRRHADLYEFGRWFDLGHLNEEAARLYSSQLAERVAALLE